MNYTEFLMKKTKRELPTGIEVEVKNESLFEWQKKVVQFALKRGSAALFEDTGLGKGQPYGSKVLTTTGWKAIETLTTDDYVYARDGMPYRIKGVYPKQELDTYRFYYTDNTSCVFDIDHLHFVRTCKLRAEHKDFKVMSTKELLQSNIHINNSGVRRRVYDVPLVNPIAYGSKEFYISPYTIGALIGDGGLTNRILFTTPDVEIADRIARELPDGYTVKKKDEITWAIICNKHPGNQKSVIRAELERLGLFGKYSYEKYIPHEYLTASVEQRIDLLRGLMDTDAYSGDSIEYCTTSEQLCNDVVELIRSLGGVPKVSTKIPKYDHGTKTGRKAYRIIFSLKGICPFYLKRKAEKWIADPRDNGRWIDKIEYVGKQRTVCISVDSPDHSYVTENFLVTHNTAQQLVWSEEINRYTNKPVLIVAPLAVSAQTKREAEKFGIEVPVKIVRDAGQVINGINITNYEILHHFDTSVFSGVVLDESSILKAYMGKTKRMIVDAFKRTPFKLACTATPAPNDLMELLNHAEFLNIMKSSEALSIWFIADQSQSGHYRLKGHAEKDFWDWVATWAICMDKPSDIGYSDEGYILPPLNVKDEIVKTDWFDETGRLRDIQTSATGFYKEKAFTAPLRVERTVEIVAEHPDEQFVIWCDTNDEADRLKKALPDCVEVRGSDKPEKKEQAAIDFVNGKIRVLVSKSEIFGFGLNFQNCHNTIFCGMNYSFEGYYQAVRRFHRFGQPLQVNVWRVMGDTEHNILTTIERKEKMKEHMQKSMSASMKDAQISNLKGLREFKISESKAKYDIPAWLTSVR